MLIPTSYGDLYGYTGGKCFDAALPAIAFLHGAQHDHSVWILQSRYFAHHGYSVLALDLPDHGRSRGAALTNVETMADAVCEALLSTGAERWLVAGHSMGSLIALEVARRLPRLIVGIALLGTACPMRVSEALLSSTRDDPEAAMNMINIWSHRGSIAAFNAKPSNPGPGFSIVWQNLRLMQRIARQASANTLHLDFTACNAYSNGVEATRSIKCPALVITADRDQMTPAKSAQTLINAATNITVHSLANTGHAMMAENPDGVLGALKNFAAQLPLHSST